MKSVTFDH